LSTAIITKSILCAVLVLVLSAPPRRAVGQQGAPPADASLADWQRRIAAAPGAEQAAVRQRFAAVRNRLVRDERVPQVLRLSTSGEAFRAACAAEEGRGAGLGGEIWQVSGDEVIAAIPPASRRRLAQAGIASEVLFESVADWQRARSVGVRQARSIEPYL
jgi:hypothetical protein